MLSPEETLFPRSTREGYSSQPCHSGRIGRLFFSFEGSRLETEGRMKRESLQNYLLMCRRRTGLSQEDVAYLLGSSRETTISRHESFQRLPELSIACGYEVIYRIPVHGLFVGHFRATEAQIQERARKLLSKLEADPKGPRVLEKRAALGEITRAQLPIVVPYEA